MFVNQFVENQALNLQQFQSKATKAVEPKTMATSTTTATPNQTNSTVNQSNTTTNNNSNVSKQSRNFMSQFRDNKTKELKNLTSAQFMEVWSHYDHDGK